MKVLIGITSKNRKAILPKAIDSALSQDYFPKKISVFDDASTDGTAALEKDYPQVKWIISSQPRGLLYARNLFIEQTDATFFASLDDDSWFLGNHALQQAIKYMNEHPDTGAIAFDILSPGNSEIKYKEIVPEETNNYIGCGHLLNIEAARKAGLYTPFPGYYGGEEKDLCIRLIESGYRIVKLNGLYVWHDKTNLSRNLQFQHRSGVCNDLVFMVRRTPLILLIPSFFIKIYKHFWFSINYKGDRLVKPCLLGFADFFRFLFSFKINRKPVSIATFRHYMKLQ